MMKNKNVLPYKHDLDLRIKYLNNRPFYEPWATNFPDKNAALIQYGIYYQDNLIETKYCVGVDGLQAIVPLPEITDFSFSEEDHHFAEIINRLQNLDEYITRIQAKYKQVTS